MNDYKHLNRKIRVLRLLAVTRAYHHYTMMELYRKSLQHDNTWADAEHLSDFMNAIMPYGESSPKDFLHDKDEMADTVLQNYEEFKRWTELVERTCISEKTLTAFCKNVDNLSEMSIPATLGRIISNCIIFLHLSWFFCFFCSCF